MRFPAPRRSFRKLARQAYRRPVTDADVEDLLSLYQEGRNKADFEAGIRTVSAGDLADPEFVFRFERDARRTSLPVRTTASAIWNWLRVCPISCGAAPRTSELISVASQGKLKNRPCWSSRSGACWRTRGRRRCQRFSPTSGCTCRT